MALVRCKSCGEEFAVGCMPTATCGMLVMPALGTALASPWVAWRHLGWPSLLLPVPVFFVVLFAIHYVPWTIEYLLAHCGRCPNCGGRRGSYPFTRGFGL